jgi:hypothetical protein
MIKERTALLPPCELSPEIGISKIDSVIPSLQLAILLKINVTTEDSKIFSGTWSPTDAEILKYLREKHLFPPSKVKGSLQSCPHNLAFLA